MLTQRFAPNSAVAVDTATPYSTYEINVRRAHTEEKQESSDKPTFNGAGIFVYHIHDANPERAMRKALAHAANDFGPMVDLVAVVVG